MNPLQGPWYPVALIAPSEKRHSCALDSINANGESGLAPGRASDGIILSASPTRAHTHTHTVCETYLLLPPNLNASPLARRQSNALSSTKVMLTNGRSTLVCMCVCVFDYQMRHRPLFLYFLIKSFVQSILTGWGSAKEGRIVRTDYAHQRASECGAV